MTNKNELLMILARQNSFNITVAEKNLFKASIQGKIANYQTGSPDQDSPNQSAQWSNERVLQADRIAWLCTDKNALKFLTNRGIRISGARIDGPLDLRFTEINIPIYFLECSFSDEILLKQSKARELDFSGSHVQSILADGISVEGPISLKNKFKSNGEVRFLGSKIGGNFDCTSSEFINPNGKALSVERSNIEGSVLLRDEFEASGEVNLISVSIGDSFICEGGKFINPNGYAITADGMTVKGFVSFSIFKNEDEQKNKNFIAEGEVRLVGSKIGDSLVFNGGNFTNSDDIVIHADGIHVEGNTTFGESFCANGEVCLKSAQINGVLDLCGIQKDSDRKFDLQFAKVNKISIDDSFLKSGVEAKTPAKINSERVYVVSDDQCPCKGLDQNEKPMVSAPENFEFTIAAKTQIKFSNCIYSDIGIYRKEDDVWYPEFPDSEKLLYLLRHLPKSSSVEFSMQPYEQLASVLRSNGYKRAAIGVLVGSQNDLRRYGDLECLAKRWNLLLDLFIGHGYRPHKVLLGVIISIFAGYAVFWKGYSDKLITPSRVNPYQSENSSKKKLSDDYPTFNSFIYSVDTFIPLVDLYQKNYRLPNVKRKSTFLNVSIHSGLLLKGYLYFHTTLGWILSLIWVASITNLVRKN